MTSKSEKGKRVTKYLTGRSAIPNLRYEAKSQEIEAPYPYSLTVTTDAAAWRFFHYVKELPHDKIAAVIRYDRYIDSVDEAVVAMKLEAFSTLLAAHYESISDRINTERK
jgi:hypothetical protein